MSIFKKVRRVISGNHPARLEAAAYLRQIAAIEVAREIDRLKDRSSRSGDSLRLTGFEQKIFSQFGEDGITLEIFRRIGTTNQQFVEFGVGNGLENNSVCLLMTGWQGLWIEIDPGHQEAIKSSFSNELGNGQLTLLTTPVNSRNVERLFSDGKVPDEPDLLSIDIDGNDYYVWEAITKFRPRLVICEYNSLFPPPQRWRMKEEPDGVPITSHFGASLSSLCDLAEKKGYVLVACSLSGANAFFVRTDLVTDRLFAAPFTAENHYEPPRYYLYPQWTGHERRNGPRLLD